MLSPRSKRTTAMRPCGPSPFSTFTKRRSMSAFLPCSSHGSASALQARAGWIDCAPCRNRSHPSPSNAASMRCSPVTPSPVRRAPSSRVMRAGQIEVCKGYGLASIELGVPITPRTRFRIASVSKQFTVTAALMLAAEGKLDLSDPPHKYLPELKPLPVTIDQMMRNSSGLPDFLELLRLGGHGLDKPARAVEFLDAAARNGHLNFDPGSRFLYSNTNFLLLGLIIEKVTQAEAGRRAGRAHLQAARHDRHDAGGRHRHGDPEPRHRLSRRRHAGFPPRRARLSAGRRRRPDLDGRGSAGLVAALRCADRSARRSRRSSSPPSR